jgi:coenzyme F420 biosynthesis associated uncharacterized protein
VIDWKLAERVASTVSGATAASPPIDAALNRLAGDAAQRVARYTALTPATPLPPPESVDRDEWVRANLGSMRPLVEPLMASVGQGMGVLAGPTRMLTGGLLAVQIGGLLGFMSQRVLGQYELTMLDPESPTRLLFVAPNLARAASELGADPDQLLAWVTFHETTHAVQFAGVPWLRGHVAGLVRELLDSVEVKVDTAALRKLPTAGDLRQLIAALREGGLLTALAGPERRRIIDALQATMAIIEGHAEHVMDVVGAESLPSLDDLRASLDRRRRSRPPLMRVLERLLGLELKLRQYEVGKRFCDAVVARGGIEALNQVWSSPAALPSLAELDRPEEWLSRLRLAPAPAA